MPSSAYTIKREQFEKNIKLVYEYEREREMNHAEFAKMCGINYSTFEQIASGRFNGTIFTWRKIKAATNLKIEYDQKICDCLPPKLSKNENEESCKIDLCLDVQVVFYMGFYSYPKPSKFLS